MLLTLVLVVFLVASAMTWQHLRYLRIRRDSAQDKQRLLHGAEAFHVLVFFKLKSGVRVVDTVRRFQHQIVTHGKARLVYAGQAACTIHSTQLAQHDWDGVLLFEYASRSDYQEILEASHFEEARRYFSASYVHGMRRNCQRNLAIPQFLLRLRLLDIVRGKWRVPPLQESPVIATFPEFDIWRTRAARLRALHEVNRHGLVVFSLVKQGNRAQQTHSDDFGRKMASRMAALAHGPLHIGRAVALEDFARFDQVLVMHYPSAAYFADLLCSQFFQVFLGKMPVGDSLSVYTVPVTDRL